jgi:hypothetical protein
MNHPKPEEWVAYVYGETAGTVRRDLKAHLQACSDCRKEVETWKSSMARLDAWQVPKKRGTWFPSALPMLRWAAVWVLILAAGVMIGRATAPKVDPESLRAAITPEIQKQVGAELAQFAREEAARAAFLSLASSRRYTDQVAQQLYVVVKKDVDTVALNADEGLRHTAQQLVQLADFSPAQTPENSNQ